jgi:hypothetical protein
LKKKKKKVKKSQVNPLRMLLLSWPPKLKKTGTEPSVKTQLWNHWRFWHRQKFLLKKARTGAGEGWQVCEVPAGKFAH